MKKLILIAAVILMAGITYGQNLQKGNLIGTHVMTVTLQPGVTMEKYMEFFNAKVIPEIEKNFLNWKAYLLKGIKGENNNSFGLLYIIKSAQDRDKYYNADDSNNEAGQAAYNKVKPALDELAKLGAFTTKYTDWVIQ